MPLEGEQLVVNPSYRFAHVFNRPESDSNNVVNSWWSRRYHVEVGVGRNKDGKAICCVYPGSGNQVDKLLHTMGCSEAWGIEQEATALQLLATMLPHHMFKKYLLTGTIIETSKRSQVMYVFRKLRPTIAIKEQRDGSLKALCTLCMHPIAYYANTWAGAMCPTDDVIAHLAMMRGDEVMLWRRSNQHSILHPASGL